MPDHPLVSTEGLTGGDVAELAAEAFKRLSGKERHSSNCATSVAPAFVPGPCNCGSQSTNLS